MKTTWVALGAALSMGMAGAAQAGYIEATVSGTAGPWDWTSGGVNAAFAYGPDSQTFTAPTRVKLSDIGSGVGSDLFILYKSGLVSNFNDCCGGPWGPSGEDTSTYKDDVLGSSGEKLPSFYIQGSWGTTVVLDFNSNTTDNPNGLVADADEFGVFLMALIGVLTDDNGEIVGSPFAVGAVSPFATEPLKDSVGRAFGIGLSFHLDPVAYAGATYLNLGINDDLFRDNGGEFRVCVASSDPEIGSCIGDTARVPEPGTLALLAAGIVGACSLRRRRAD